MANINMTSNAYSVTDSCKPQIVYRGGILSAPTPEKPHVA